MVENAKRVATLNEERLAAQADAPPESREPMPGKPLPEGFVNPPCGTPLHKCVDERGNYNPTYVQLNLRRPEGMKGDQEFFRLNRESKRISFNKWEDQPPWVSVVLADAVKTVYRRNVDAAGRLMFIPGFDTQPLQVEEMVPAFAYNIIASA